ncbi:MAG: Rrf2 family transcriptional regulator [Phycisphaerales bacterium]|nr:Rrf2 family transcriptional regulator [Phycisphaerales bacterium]
MISQTTEYALRAVVWLAANPEKPLTAQQIAEATRVPAGYLAKVLQGLSRAGLLNSQRGLGGGFTLAKAPSAMTMWEVVQAVDPLKRIKDCPLGFEAHAGALCLLHQQVDDAIATIEKQFSSCKISKLIDPNHAAAPLCAYQPKGSKTGSSRRSRR